MNNFTLMIIIIFVKLIMELLFMSSFWFDVISLKKEKHIKRSELMSIA